MDIQGWNDRYRTKARASEDLDSRPTKLLAETAGGLIPGTVLDLACGAGRNAVWLAQNGWDVTAVDGAEAAIAILATQARELGLAIKAVTADLQKGGYEIQANSWDLITICYYLQRDLIETAKRGVRPGGTLLVIAHITEAGEEPTESRLRPGELEKYFSGWDIVHRHEGKPDDPYHRRSVAEVVARKPTD